MLGAVVSPVGRTLGPVVLELSLGVAALEPDVAQVHSFELVRDNGFIGDASCGRVVGLDGGAGLAQSHLFKRVLYDDVGLDSNQDCT